VDHDAKVISPEIVFLRTEPPSLSVLAGGSLRSRQDFCSKEEALKQRCANMKQSTTSVHHSVPAFPALARVA